MLFSFFRKPTRRKGAVSRRLELEALESRDVPTATLTNGILTITPTDGMAVVNATTTVQVTNNIIPLLDRVVVTRTTPTYTQTQSFAMNEASGLWVKPLITGIVFEGGAGNDTFKNLTGIPATATGGAGHDALFAGSGGDTLIAGKGNATLYGGAGKDTLIAGPGYDVLVSIGGGVDQLYAGTGTANFWYDSTDATHIPESEAANVTLHRVSSFFSYSYNGGTVQTPVSLQLLGQNLSDPSPGELGVTAKNFKTLPLFGSNGPEVSDIVQGDVGDCYFLATLGAMVHTNPASIRQLVVSLGDGTYAVNFYNANGQSVFVRVDADLWTNAAGTPVFAGLGPQKSLWVAIVEKAWAFYRDNMANYPSIAGGDSPGILPGVALNLGGADPVQPTGGFANGQAYLEAIQSALSQGQGVVLGGPDDFTNSTLETPTTRRRGQHDYVVLAVLTDANGTPTGLKLYNPHGFDVTITDSNLIYYCSIGFQTFAVS